MLEPIAYGKVFHPLKWQFPDSEESMKAKLDQRREQAKILLSGFSGEQIGTFRSELCHAAETIDNNKMVHVLLRLMAPRQRLKLRNALGATMFFLSMTEIIRRAAEEATGEQLPEEDEIGFGQWMPGARESIYGSNRILDAPPQAQRDFLTGMELDYGVKVRSYLEGATELGAMTSAAGEGTGAEFINLSGKVIERDVLAFVEALQSDKRSHVFSIVLMDKDIDKNVDALRKAAKEGKFFGRFFISDPDFEFASFAIDELVSVWLTLATRREDGVPPHDVILNLVMKVNSAKEFFKVLNGNNLCHVSKGFDWGVALMNYAIQHPKLPEGHPGAGNTRPVVEAARLIIDARRSKYVATRARFEVDPETGKLRNKQEKKRDSRV